MEKAMVAISFDDGRSDNVEVIEKQLIPHEIPVTLYVATGYVDGSCPKEKNPTDEPAMSVEDVIRLCGEPLVEIGLHGDMHLNEDWDIRNGWKKLAEWVGELLGSQSFGFASPGTGYPIDRFRGSVDPFFHEQVLYLAMGLRIRSLSRYRTLSRKAARVVRSPFLFRAAYRETLMRDCPDRVVYRVPVHASTSCGQIKALVDDAVRSKAALTLMFHSIGVPDGGTWSWDQRKFSELCAYLLELRKRGSVELVKVRDIAGRLPV